MFSGRIDEAPLDFPCFSVLSWPMCALAPQTRVLRLREQEAELVMKENISVEATCCTHSLNETFRCVMR